MIRLLRAGYSVFLSCSAVFVTGYFLLAALGLLPQGWW